jgi:hypothetical protein
VVAAAGLVGCVGGIDTPTPTPQDPPPGTVGDGGKGPAAAMARTMFETNVYPVLAATGRCVNCHALAGPVGNVTGFVAPTVADAYVTAVGFQALVGDWTPTGAPILLKVAAGHNGQTYTNDEKAKITAWLNQELTARSGNTGTTPPTGESPADATVRLTKEWSGCMTQANFTTANMTAWGNMRANNSRCVSCHGNAEYGQIASDAVNPFFTVISTNKYYMAQYFSVDLSQGVATAKVIINTKSFDGVRQGIAPHLEHPRFTLIGSTGMAALQKFYDLTMASKTAGTCGPPTLKN